MLFRSGPVGIDTLAACTGEDAITIEDVYEPFLMQIGYLAKTPRGRVLTRLGWQHLGLSCPLDYEQKLKGMGRALNGVSRTDGLSDPESVESARETVQLELELPGELS